MSQPNLTVDGRPDRTVTSCETPHEALRGLIRVVEQAEFTLTEIAKTLAEFDDDSPEIAVRIRMAEVQQQVLSNRVVDVQAWFQPVFQGDSGEDPEGDG